MRMAQIGRLFRAAGLVALAGAAGAPACAEEAAAGPAPDAIVYAYDVSTPDFGSIGHYVNHVRMDGNRTIVDTKIEIDVKVLFMSAFALSAERRETWQDGSLIAFEGETHRDGEVIELDVTAEDGSLQVDGPRGRTAVPRDVVPLNPWSTHILDMTQAMSTENGRIWSVTVSEGQPAELEIDGRALAVRHYRLEGDGGAEVWFDAAGRPVRFATNEDGHVLTFTLSPSLSRFARAE